MISPAVRQQWFKLLRSPLRFNIVQSSNGHTNLILRPRRLQHTLAQESRLPRIAQPSTWQLVFPRVLRSRSAQPTTPGSEKQTNPATYFIWIYLLIGSQAIRIIAIQNEFKTFTRTTDRQLEKLREVVEKLQRGEEVDVEKILGTGVESEEAEWERALQELESEERVWQNNRKKRREETERLAQEEQDADPINISADKPIVSVERTADPPKLIPRPPSFY